MLARIVYMLVEAAKSSWRESMNEKLTLLMSYVQSGSVFAPLIFITFHLLRQFLFIPVIVVCISGGFYSGSFWNHLLHHRSDPCPI